MTFTPHKLLALFSCATLLSGCANMNDTQQTAAKGAGMGAIAGAVLGSRGGSGGTARGALIGGALGAGGGYLWSKRMQDQKAEMERATAGTGVAVSQTADNRLKMDIPSDISFATGRSDISANLSPILNRFANTLQQNQVTRITIVGHTDSTGNDAINQPLSLDRANSARDYLVARGVARLRIMTDGRGANEPIASNTSEAGRSSNRRVEIFVAEPAQAANVQ
jgi:outer membrane protein OmpA-like peptidoglycan-associated protein